MLGDNMGKDEVQSRIDAAVAAAKCDAYANLANMMGTSRDPYVQTGFKLGTVFGQQELEAMYRFDWMSRKIIEVIPEDATREWIDFKTEDEDIVTAITTKLKELKAK